MLYSEQPMIYLAQPCLS